MARRRAKRRKPSKIYTFSHGVMAGIMLMFFVGVALGVYTTISRGEPLTITLDYIMELAKIVALGYFVKAFGENIAKIVLSARFGGQHRDATDDQNNSGGAVG